MISWRLTAWTPSGSVCCWRISARLKTPSTARAADGATPDYPKTSSRPPGAGKVAAITDWLAADPTHHLIARGDSQFPTALEDFPDVPAALFARGRLAALAGPQIKMVGSRTPTTGGRRNARAFAHHQAARGLVITSGLALGVDGEAHRGARDADEITIAALGSGLEHIYPPEHASLA